MFIESLMSRAFYLFNEQPFNFQLNIESTILIGAGLGSSVALSTAIVKALGSMLNKDLTEAKTIDYANELENFFHGSPSG